ncbi:MAG: bifunctional enoyl-CoA hydratase/phosphate acetyltransferase [Marinilabiliales bacterium]|nr:bifunctional enoyl-CoA hydratase/phosphate acetyltransferase [Marinilabiliales bacterium]
MIKKLSDFQEEVLKRRKRTLVVVSANDNHSVSAAYGAVREGLIQAILIGDKAIIEKICREEDFDLSRLVVHHQPDDRAAASLAVEMIRRGDGDILMKGLIPTDKFLKAILDKEKGLLDQGSILSHVTVIENPNYHKLMIVSDVAVLPQPDLGQKVQLIRYMTKVANALGIGLPKVAVIAPSEQLLPQIESSRDAAFLSKMGERGQITGCLIDGPLALDLAIDEEAARIKGIKSAVAGDADCLLFPNLDAGNIFYKTNMKLALAESAAMLVGARVPVVLTSRGDSTQTKLYSIALASLVS